MPVAGLGAGEVAVVETELPHWALTAATGAAMMRSAFWRNMKTNWTMSCSAPTFILLVVRQLTGCT